MINEIFYDIVDSESMDLSVIFENNEHFQSQSLNGKKSFCFLIWFLQNYLPDIDVLSLEEFITEGNDDSSSDLIFNNTNQLGEEVFYVVQAKWFSRNKIGSSNGIKKEIKACMTDFKLILSGKKKLSTVNDPFNRQYKKFLDHKKENKKIKFIFLALCSGNIDISEYVEGFSEGKLVSFELFDFSKLKRHYIEIQYKGIRTHNPIEEPYLPVSKIDLTVEKNQIIAVDAPFRSNIFIIRPEVIFSLFDKFGNSIFYRNIRNPLPHSLYNLEIYNTVLHNPKYFWYFNNGITAITEKIEDFYNDTVKVSIRGLQIINGAQTVYNVYVAYKNANEAERKKMNEDTLITLRVVETGGSDFDLNVTRYTNSQNPISEKDFHSNDEVQKRLQNDFFDKTNVFYETRQGEFIKDKYPDSIKLTNELLAQYYLAYFVNDPFSAKQKKARIFYSNKIKTDGLYETIFNDKTEYQDMLVAYYLHSFIERKRKEFKKSIDKIDTTKKLSKDQKRLLKFDFIQYANFEILALFKLLLFKANEKNIKTINNKTLELSDNRELKVIEDCYEIIIKFISKDLEKRKIKDSKIVNSVLFKNKEYYQDLKLSFIDFISKKNLKKYKYV